MRSAEEFSAVQRLIAAGMNDCAIAQQTGVPRTTVCDWRRRPQVRSRSGKHQRATSMTFLAYQRMRTAIFWLCAWATSASRDAAECASEDHARHEVSRNHPPLSQRHRYPDARAARSTHRLCDNPSDAPSYRTTRSTSLACFHSMVRAGNT
ncbi:MAG TPA: helix-turn-helix domain-containing protein [Mycobacterium sp.]|nr:helix-turn-helix domain-containing protein [Mycobacterium sp.]